MISVEAVTKRFGALTAVDALSFEIDRGEVMGFLGPNGAGKTTTMRMLTGTLEPDEGRVLFDGAPIGTDLEAAKSRVGYLPESNPLYDEMLVCEYLEYAGRLRAMEEPALRSAIRDAVDETGLAKVFFRPVSELSKGFRQRVGLAAAILHRPEILVLDEPTEGLDPNQRVEIRRLIGDLRQERTVLLSTHVMQEVEATCSRLIIISNGRLVADGSVRDLVTDRSASVTFVVEAHGQGVVEGLQALEGAQARDVTTVDDRVRIRLEVPRGEEMAPVIFNLARDRGWTLWELHREQASLEDLFRDLTRDESAWSPAVGEAPIPAGSGELRAEAREDSEALDEPGQDPESREDVR